MYSFKHLFFFLISAVAMIWVISWIEKDLFFAEFRNLKLEYLALAVCSTIVSYLLRALRWPLFFSLNPPKFKDSYRYLILGFFMNNILPARLGELVRAHLGGKATSQSRARVLATIAAERLADGIMISIIFAVLFTVAALPTEKAQAKELFFVAYLFCGIGLLTAIFLSQRHLAFMAIEWLAKIIPGKFARYILVRARRFIEGLEGILSVKRLIIIIISSVIIWSVELSVFYFVSLAFNQSLSLGALSLFLAAVNFSSLIPAAPGGIGVIEAFATLALSRIGIEPSTALAMVASQHLIQFVVIGVPGIYFFIHTLKGKLPIDMQQSAKNKSDSSSKQILLGKPEVELSIIIPAYNEESRISKTLQETQQYIAGTGLTFEILVVSDGSKDQTDRVVQKLANAHNNIRLLSYSVNRGKGYAVRHGVTNARGAHILFMDADGATHAGEFSRLRNALGRDFEIAIGSRAMESEETKVDARLRRKIIGRIFASFVSLLVVPGIKDTQCGFKLFTRKAAREIFSRQRADGFSFDVELLFLAKKMGLEVVEVPINWTHIPGSKVNLLTDSLKMAYDLLRFRLLNIMGAYNG